MTSNSLLSWKEARRWLPGLLISVVALFLVFRLAGWKDLGSAFASFRPSILILVVALTLLYLAARAMATRALLENQATFFQSFFAVNEGYLLNNLFPLRAGEIGRAVLLGNATGLGPFHVLSVIVIERSYDLAFAAGLLLSTLPMALSMAWAKSVAVVTLVLVVLGLAALYLMARNQQVVRNWVEKIAGRWNFIHRFVLPQIDALLNGMKVLTKPTQFLVSVAWVACSWVIAVFLYYLMATQIVPGAPFWWGAFLDSVLAMGIAIPSAPAALGVFEASIVGAFAILGVEHSSALAYAITLHFLQFIVTGVLGFYGLWKDGRSLGSLFKDLRLQENNRS